MRPFTHCDDWELQITPAPVIAKSYIPLGITLPNRSLCPNKSDFQSATYSLSIFRTHSYNNTKMLLDGLIYFYLRMEILGKMLLLSEVGTNMYPSIWSLDFILVMWDN